MKRFLIGVDITAAEGTQTFYVDAETEEEALEVFKKKGGEFYCEEICVMDTGSPEIVGEVDLDDTGDRPA